jgi:hypothetical protein
MTTHLQVGPLAVTFHRTVRVAEGRTPAALPPGLGRMELYTVSDFRAACPATWEDDAVFVCLHPGEALWMSFSTHPGPLAVICGAGGVNALTGELLKATLEKDAYLVTPPQPWLDGWKDKDSGNVFQFVATEYRKGDGNTVAEQLIGAESKSGGIGLAVFEPLDRAKLKAEPVVDHSALHWMNESSGGAMLGGLSPDCASDDTWEKTRGPLIPTSASFSAPNKPGGQSCGLTSLSRSFVEHGVGKGGAIVQKVYPDPHGIEVWKTIPVAVKAVYIVSSDAFEEITGKKAPPPVKTQEEHGGVVPWFKTHDQDKSDVAGSDKFTGLKSVFKESKE